METDAAAASEKMESAFLRVVTITIAVARPGAARRILKRQFVRQPHKKWQTRSLLVVIPEPVWSFDYAPESAARQHLPRRSHGGEPLWQQQVFKRRVKNDEVKSFAREELMNIDCV